MAKVESPKFRSSGMVGCDHCPLEEYECQDMFVEFSDGKLCPTAETYQEAVELAEKEAQR